MEVPLVSLVLLFSCTSAVDIKKVNNSIFDDFQLLDRLIQQEICKMLKEVNASSKFNLDEKLEAGPDLCNDLSLENQDDRNSMLMDTQTSQMSKLDRIPFLEPGSTSGEDERTKRYTLLPNSPAANTSLADLSEKGFPFYETLKTSGTRSTVQENPSFLKEEPSKVMDTWINEDSIIPANSHDQSSSELSSISNMTAIIINSNTPMSPDPTYNAQEFNSPNPRKLFPIPHFDEYISRGLNSTASCRHSASSGSTSCSICFPGKCQKSSNSSIDEHSSGSRSAERVRSGNDFESSTLSPSEVGDHRISEDFPTEIHILPEKVENESSKPNNFTDYPVGHGYQYTPTPASSLCSECSPSSGTTIYDFFYNMTCLRYCITIPSAQNFTSDTNSSNQFELTSTPSSFVQANILQDFTSRPSSSSYSSKTTYNPELLPEIRGFMPMSSSSSNSSTPASSSAPYIKSEISYDPPSKSSTSYNVLGSFANSSSESPTSEFSTSLVLQNFFNSASESSTSSNISAPSSDTFSTNTFNGLLGFTHSIPEFTNPASFSTSLPVQQTAITAGTDSITDFCGLSTLKHYQSLNTTTSPKSTPKPWCSHVKLTANPKSPRATRRRTKVYAAVGNLHSYAGFFNVNQQDNVRLFFWFFCNSKWRDTPLIVWLQGEPGQSSLHGLFQENGPYYVDYGINIKLREFSWTKEYNVLYLDSCVGCGFSTADHEETHYPTYDNVSRNVYEALIQFFKIWHEMKSNDLYLAGSYGGAKYIPVIANKIHDENAKNEVCRIKMNLKGMLIGGPYVDAAAMTNYNGFLLANGIIDEVTHNEMMPLQQHAQELIRAGKYQDAIDFLNIHVYCLISQAGYEEYKDVRILKELPYQNIRNIFRAEQFKRMICIDEMDFKSKSDLLIEEIMPSVDQLMPKLLSNYKVLYYNGQFDLMAPYMLTSEGLSKLEWDSIDRFYTTEMIHWYPFQNETDCPRGFYRNYLNLTHVMVRNTGHSVGETDSKSLFYLLKWFVEDKFQRYQYNGNWYE